MQVLSIYNDIFAIVLRCYFKPCSVLPGVESQQFCRSYQLPLLRTFSCHSVQWACVQPACTKESALGSDEHCWSPAGPAGGATGSTGPTGAEGGFIYYICVRGGGAQVKTSK